MSQHTVLGILDSIFPWMIADKIYSFVMIHYKDSLISYWEVLPDTFVTSAFDNSGVDEILEFINQSIKRYSIKNLD